MAHWLLKTEPTTYSFTQLKKDGSTNWNGVRNFQARNNLREMKKGDLALIYHSGDDKAVQGIARIAKEAYKDPDPEGGDWVQVDLQYGEPLAKPVTLAAIKADKAFAGLQLVTHSRLSVMPVIEAHFRRICSLGGRA